MNKKVLGLILLVAGMSFAAQAVDVMSKNAGGNVESAAVWTAGPPTSSDVAVWKLSGNGHMTNALGADVSWLGIRVDVGIVRDIIINTTGTGSLTLGSAGIDMSADPTDVIRNLFTIKPNVILGAAQTWNVAENSALDRALQVDGIISGTAGSTLTKAGSGTLVLNGDNTYSGTTTISGGKLQVGASAGSLTGTLGTGDVINDGLIVFKRTNTMTVANNISGSGSVSYINSGTRGGTYTVTGNNTYTGDTVITNGNTVIVGSNSNLGNGTKLFVGQNAELLVTNSFATSKEVTLGGGNPLLNVDANQTLTLNSGVTSVSSATSGSFPITKAGAGKLVLNGAGSFSDKSTFYVSSGALDLGNAAALNGATLRMHNNALLDNTSGSNMTVTGMNSFLLNSGMAFTGSKDLDMSTAQAGFSGATVALRTVTVSSNTLTLSGILVTGTDVSGSVRTNAGLIKAGRGTLVLKGDSDYTFNTVITNNGGKLVINGINLSSNITAYAGATLGGTGTVQSVTMLVGSTLSAGNSPGTMTFNEDVLLSEGSTNIMEITDIAYDILMGAATNTLTMSGVTVFDFTGFTGGVTNGYTLAWSDMFQNWGATNITGTATYSALGLGVDQSLAITGDGFTVIPEPATIGMLGLGALITLMLRRMRTR